MLNIVLGYADTDPFDKVETFEFKPGIVPIENTDLNKALETVKNTVTNAPSSTSTSTEPGIITEAKKYAKMSGLTLTQFFLLLVLLTMLLLLIFKD